MHACCVRVSIRIVDPHVISPRHASPAPPPTHDLGPISSAHPFRARYSATCQQLLKHYMMHAALCPFQPLLRSDTLTTLPPCPLLPCLQSSAFVRLSAHSCVPSLETGNVHLFVSAFPHTCPSQLSCMHFKALRSSVRDPERYSSMHRPPEGQRAAVASLHLPTTNRRSVCAPAFSHARSHQPPGCLRPRPC